MCNMYVRTTTSIQECITNRSTLLQHWLGTENGLIVPPYLCHSQCSPQTHDKWYEVVRSHYIIIINIHGAPYIYILLHCSACLVMLQKKRWGEKNELTMDSNIEITHQHTYYSIVTSLSKNIHTIIVKLKVVIIQIRVILLMILIVIAEAALSF